MNPVHGNLITLISAQSLRSLETGTWVVDILISLLIVYVLTHWIQVHPNDVWTNVRGWCFGKSKEYSKILVGRSYKTKYRYTHSYSLTFRALTYWLEQKQLLECCREIHTCTGSYVTMEEALVIPESKDNIRLTPTVKCSISSITRENNDRVISITLSSKKSLKDIEDLLIQVRGQYNDRIADTFLGKQFYFCPQIHENEIEWHTYEFHSTKTMNHVFFKEKVQVLSQIQQFLHSPEMYQRRGVPWTLGILLYGKPGTGKTSFVKALSKMTMRHLIEVPLSRIQTYEHLKEVFYNTTIKNYRLPYDKRIYLIEDIDCLNGNLVQKRSESLEEEGISSTGSKLKCSFLSNNDKVTLSHLLNVIDGPLEIPGRILILTTNHPDKIDPALLREGRIDIKIEMEALHGETLREMVSTWYNVEPKTLNAYAFQNTAQYTPAEVENMCWKQTLKEVCEKVSS
jgi:hypothetical protein